MNIYKKAIMDNRTIIENRIQELNNILTPFTRFTESTWPNKKGLPYIYKKGAWKNIISSLKKISVTPNYKKKFSKKIKESDDYRKTRELGGEIIIIEEFMDSNPILEYHTNGNKDVDICIDINNKKICIEVSTLNLARDDEQEITENISKQITDGKLRVVIYWDKSYKRIQTSVRNKATKFLKDSYNFLLLYNVADADNEDLQDAVIGKVGLTSNTMRPNIFRKFNSPVHGIGLFDWDRKNMSIIFNPNKQIPDYVKSKFANFKVLDYTSE